MSAGDGPGSYASPPCYMHEVDPAYTGLGDERQHSDVHRWRKAERQRLISLRLAQSVAQREARDVEIRRALGQAIGRPTGRTLGIYWPFRGEPNLMLLLRSLVEEGASLALPVVVGKGKPLLFRDWKPGDKMARGVWDIPVPFADAPERIPDLVIAPVVGFDPSGYRLGYGGGFYDRTLAGLAGKAETIGVGYGIAAIPTIYPQWHDIAMDRIITEDGEAVRRG